MPDRVQEAQPQPDPQPQHRQRQRYRRKFIGGSRQADARQRSTENDLAVLAFAAEHHFVTRGQVAKLLGVKEDTAVRRLRRLATTGLMKHQTPFREGGGCWRITGAGLARIASKLKPSRVDLQYYEHTVGAAWLYLAAQSGRFGPLRELVSERRMRSHDGTPEGRRKPLAVRVDGFAAGGRPRLHYPDLVFVDAAGRRVAVELELTGKRREERERILGGYAADARFDAVLYLVGKRAIGRNIQATARALGIEHMVHLRSVRVSDPIPTRGAPDLTRAAVRAPTRSAPRAQAREGTVAWTR